jgi:hypothetical protein
MAVPSLSQVKPIRGWGELLPLLFSCRLHHWFMWPNIRSKMIKGPGTITQDCSAAPAARKRYPTNTSGFFRYRAF